MNTFLKNTFWVSAGFAGGFAAGVYIAGKEKRKKIRQLAVRMEAILSEAGKKSRTFHEAGRKRMRSVSGRLRKELSDPVPDLYKATESLSLDENDLING